MTGNRRQTVKMSAQLPRKWLFARNYTYARSFIFFPRIRLGPILLGRVAFQDRGRDRSRHLRLWLVERPDRSCFWRPVVNLQRGPGVQQQTHAKIHAFIALLLWRKLIGYLFQSKESWLDLVGCWYLELSAVETSSETDACVSLAAETSSSPVCTQHRRPFHYPQSQYHLLDEEHHGLHTQFFKPLLYQCEQPLSTTPALYRQLQLIQA